MPFRTMSTLQEWVDDFRALGYDDAGILRVIPQDSEDGADAGLIAAQLKSVSTTFFVAPGPEPTPRNGPSPSSPAKTPRRFPPAV